MISYYLFMKRLSKAPVLKHFYKVFKAPLGDENDHEVLGWPMVEFDSEFLRNIRQFDSSVGNPGVRAAG